MTEPNDPAAPPPYGAPPPPYGAPPPAYGAPPSYPGAGYPPPPPAYGAPGGEYGPPPGRRVNDPADMGSRLVARLIDGIIVGVVSGVIAEAVGIHLFRTTTNADGTKGESFKLYNGDYFKFILIILIIGGLYEVVMLVSRGATLGKMAMGVRVAMLENGQKPDLGAAVVRWLIPGLAGAIFGLLQLIVYLSPFFDSSHRNRGWYDYAAKTIAVRTK
jgi:uncharacterized RDD family membrane protein YckC